MDKLEVITTGDGSHSLLNTQLNETYHSVHGALRESTHVFIANGLHYFHSSFPEKDISILEIGFGTGLNALLALQYATQHRVRIRYTTLEPFPLDPRLWRQLNYTQLDPQLFESIHSAPWDEEAAITPEFVLFKRTTSLQEATLSQRFDVIFFDAFAPSVQPELWTYVALEKVVKNLKRGGVFVTYSAKGQVKRDLKTLGLKVETLPGPPGKLEMIRALYSGDGGSL